MATHNTTDPEVEALQRAYDQIAFFEDVETRKRLLRYLWSRLVNDEPNPQREESRDGSR